MHKIYSLHYTTKYMNTYMVWCTREQRGSQRLNHRPSNQQMMFCSTTWATGVYSVREAVSSVGADSLSFLCVWRFWTFERLTQVWRRWHVLQLVTNLKKMSVCSNCRGVEEPQASCCFRSKCVDVQTTLFCFRHQRSESWPIALVLWGSAHDGCVSLGFLVLEKKLKVFCLLVCDVTSRRAGITLARF